MKKSKVTALFSTIAIMSSFMSASSVLANDANVSTAEEGKYQSELTNEWIDSSLMNQRPVAIIVDNELTALPHFGLTQADVVYEMMNSTANGRITRLMALVKDWRNLQQFGNIRSVRPTNFLLAAEWNAVLIHDGGPFYINDYLKKDYVDNLSGGFARFDNGKASEFTEYVTSNAYNSYEGLSQRMDEADFSTEYNSFYEGPHFSFSDTEIDLTADASMQPASTVQLPFPHNSSTLTYNPESCTYDYSEYGTLHTDALNNNAVLSFKNVILQDCDFTQLDENGYLIYNCINADKKGYYITDGAAIPITWSKLTETDQTKYYHAVTGEEIQLNTGKTYISLVPDDQWDALIIQ